MTKLYSASMKTAVSIPDPIFEAADQLARRRKISRSELYAQALVELLAVDDATRVTERLDEVFAKNASDLDAGLARLQSSAIDEDW